MQFEKRSGTRAALSNYWFGCQQIKIVSPSLLRINITVSYMLSARSHPIAAFEGESKGCCWLACVSVDVEYGSHWYILQSHQSKFYIRVFCFNHSFANLHNDFLIKLCIMTRCGPNGDQSEE